MKQNIALVLPAYNEEKEIEGSFLNIKKGIDKFPDYKFILFQIDDGSTDKTYEAILHWGKHYGLNMEPSRNAKNMGTSQTIKKVYIKIVNTNNDIIIKTDLDSDFDQSIVLERLLPYVKTDEVIVAGVMWREITKEENAYEVMRRDDVLKIFKNELGVTELDPSSIGSQFYRRSHLKKLLEHEMVKNYDKRWGFELLLYLISAKLGKKVPAVHIEKGGYDPLRRPKEKVDAQYNTYIEIIANLTGKSPENLSGLYMG